ncbi:MAG TPA: hypothetical protein VFV49_05075 [Thermoanaerobaculia bacterium]|nr:hypothetical protein [Thermoanaerobaculia bacterium]
MTDVLSSLTYETAKTFLGQNFQIRFDDGATIDLTLEEVLLLMEKHVNPRMKRDTFSMQFRGPLEPGLRQGMYPTYHEQLGGPIQLFLVPLNRGENGYLYEAVFN